jgi:hypothetical protein
MPVKAPDPGLSFPLFPDPFKDGVAIPVLEGETVRVPLYYWKQITEYVIEVQKAKEQYDAWRLIYENLFAP